ncbi:MFS transporter [Erysipelothrix sp. HDW6C]|uniref:permease prefix domain 1-containing protein n=1 Tax=Erysipelothrix sp. HDW6C TaxID=2714930 RepID=UPI001409BB82|nr:permease prefix domain 1-containing protein [Erysipelothrix sp. HDW6C]QIK69497.1 MFS transporter [Erysipelothrix sp. HDW6C]
MNKKIAAYVDRLFDDIQMNEQLLETKEELSINLNEKYHDLLSEGNDPDVAYKKVVSGIGDVDELIHLSSTENTIKQTVEINIHGQTSDNMKKGTAIFLFITAVIPVILFGEFAEKYAVFGVAIMFTMIAIGVMLLVSISKPTEEQPTPKSVAETPKSKRIRDSIHAIIWIGATLLFFVLSMNRIRMSWTLFIVAYLVTQLADLLLYYQHLNTLEKNGITLTTRESNQQIKNFANSVIWSLAVLSFFMMGNYRYGWLSFVVAAGLSQIVTLVLTLREEQS